jgi:hypothetical protein
MKGKELLRSNIVIHGQIIEQVQAFIYVGNAISSIREVYMNNKISNYNKVHAIIGRHSRVNMSKNIKLNTSQNCNKTRAIVCI